MAHIHASRVALKLLFNGFSYEELPQNMSQAYALHCALSSLHGDYSDTELIEAWRSVLGEIPRHKRSGDRIKELINPTPVSKEELNTKIEAVGIAIDTSVDKSFCREYDRPLGLKVVNWTLGMLPVEIG